MDMEEEDNVAMPWDVEAAQMDALAMGMMVGAMLDFSF